MTASSNRLRLSYALWAAFVAIVAVAGFVLLRACGFLMPLAGALPGLGWNFCPGTPDALSIETERTATLGKLARQLELELAQKNLACASIPPPAVPPLELPIQPGPALPQQSAALKPPPEPESPVLKMPEKPTEDLSFLKGCWRTDAFKHTPALPPGVSTYCFDDKGNGQLEYRRLNNPGYVCRAPARAKYEGQQLSIRDSDTKCSDGGNWYADVLR
ncbi:MAG: hypothetical protein ACHQK9_18205, partial [Reyranellales bacterium]